MPPLPDDSLAAGMTARDRRQPATMGALAMATDAVLDLFSRLRVAARLSEAEQRLAALEAQSLPHDEGIHEPGKAHAVGSLTTRGGGLWLAVEPTDRTPGVAASGWKVIVKSGSA